jgi:hypothetical protein
MDEQESHACSPSHLEKGRDGEREDSQADMCYRDAAQLNEAFTAAVPIQRKGRS